MATQARYTRFIVDEFDFSGDSNGLDVEVTGERIENTRFQDSAKRYIAGIPELMLSQQGYFEAGTDSIEEELYARLGTGTANVAAIFGTDETNPPSYVLPAVNAHEYNVTAATGELITLSSSWQQYGYRGIQVYRGTLSSTGAQTSVDFGSAGSNGGYAYLFVTGITGSATNATIDVESSSDDASFASEGTFTFSDVGSSSVTMTGTVNQYIRANLTSLGGATDITCVLIVCVTGVTT